MVESSSQQQLHGLKVHSKYSASGAERYFKCPGSIALSQGIPSKESKYSLEGTLAHEVLEHYLMGHHQRVNDPKYNDEMRMHALDAAKHVKTLYKKENADIALVEQKVSLAFIHPEAFGTLDVAVAKHFGTLHILDFKYGRSLVSPRENLQFIFYALGVAHRFDWNFKNVKLWALQPRVEGFDGYTFWELSLIELLKYVDVFKRAFDRVETHPNEYKEGGHCYFCPAQKICPLKQSKQELKTRSLFKPL